VDRRLGETAPDRPAAFHCGWLLDGSGADARRDVVLTVADGRIEGIFPAAEGFKGLAPVDWRSFTVLPPLADAHVHLFLSGRGDSDLRRRQLDPEPEEIFRHMEARIRRHRRRGVLAVRDGGDHGALALALRHRYAAQKRAGFVLRAAGHAWHRAGRYGGTFGRGLAENRCLAEAVAADGRGIDQVKIINSGINSLTDFGRQTPPQFDPDDLKAAVAEAHRRGLPVMVHANGKQPVAEALAAGCDSIEHGFFMGEANMGRMAAQGTVWVPTAGTMVGCLDVLAAGSPEADGARRLLDHQVAQLARARELGVPVAAGTDAGSPGVRHGRAMAVELALMTAGGYSFGETVRCAAANGARLLALERPGALRPGAPADFFAVAGPPEALWQSLEQVRAVYCNGSPVDGGGWMAP
jgi:imidazolonepropionase-like amidohydrolase